MKRLTQAFIAVGLFVLASTITPQTAQASVVAFTVLNGPAHHRIFIRNVNFIDRFSVLDMTLAIDTTAGGSGSATFSGTVAHGGSGQLWNLDIEMDNVRVKPSGSFVPQAVPYPSVFEDLKNGGTLIWDDFRMNLSTNLANPAYWGRRDFVGKRNAYGDPSVLGYQSWGGSEEYWGFLAWLRPEGSNNHYGDVHFTLWDPQNTPPGIPEPGTCILFGLALLGLGAYKRFKNSGLFSSV